MNYILIFCLAGLLFTVSCKKNNTLVTVVQPVNKPPIANAGSDTTITLPTTHVILDGSKSSDPDNRPLTYKWRKLSGPQHLVFDQVIYQNPAPARIDINCYDAGEYSFELTVSNYTGLLSTDIVKITVNHLPATEHHIDILFDIDPFCKIDGQFPTTIPYNGANFQLYAKSLANFSGGNFPTSTYIDQEYEYPNYFYPASLRINEGSDFIYFYFSSAPNFFTLPYNSGSATYSDSVAVAYGGGIFANIDHSNKLYCITTADITHHTGSIRLRGSVYY